MLDELIVIVFIIFAAYMFALCGYAYAHDTVATECQKLNAFYVGDKVFDCRVRENKP